MSTFEDYVNSREVEEVVISPPLRELSSNTRLITNIKAASAWATRQNLGFSEWWADLNGWVVHGDDVPIEWSEKNVFSSFPSFLVLTMCFHGCNNLVNVKRRKQKGMTLSIRLLTS